ncbi:hypothetical protein NMY22_g7363 [Coprinellus aureogranulatus]|nr:hypothetical protein NMY22_g7363 [Coprinellus aureogranulatus]
MVPLETIKRTLGILSTTSFPLKPPQQAPDLQTPFFLMMITLFDVTSSLPGKAWNATTWKTRFSLNYKGLPYKTEWLEYPEIALVLQKHGIPPYKLKPDGTPHYTVPAILDVDDATGGVKAMLVDSIVIARYLDEAYPDTPKLLPEDKEALEEQEQVHASWLFTMLPTLIILGCETVSRLNKESQEHFSRGRAKDMYDIYKVERLEDVPLTPEHRQELWSQAKGCFDSFDAKMKEREAKNGGPWLNGEKATFADFVIGGYFLWARSIFGEESKEWKDIMQWNDGRWASDLVEPRQEAATVKGLNHKKSQFPSGFVISIFGVHSKARGTERLRSHRRPRYISQRAALQKHRIFISLLQLTSLLTTNTLDMVSIQGTSDLDQTQITLFDLDSTLEGPDHVKAFSCSTWKTRYALNFKRLPFTTVFLDFVDVDGVCQRIGAEPTIRYKPPGSDEQKVIYTVPVIYDPKTGRVVSESLAIAEYIDAAYPAPEYPALFKPGTKGLLRAFAAALDRIPTVLPTVYPFVIPVTFPIVKERSKEYFRTTREAHFNRGGGNRKLEDVIPKGEEKVEAWAKVQAAFSTIASWYAAEGGDWIMGESVSYADLVVSAYLIWIKRILKEDSDDWREVERWDGGRWKRLLESCKVYEGAA